MRHPFEPKRTRRDGPEGKIQDAWIHWLQARAWLVKPTHGNMFQHGFPDLYCAHFKYGTRWIEVKNLSGSFSFQPSQLEWFPKFNAAGIGVWILGEVCDEEYKKLWQPQNWHTYLSVSGVGRVRLK